MENYRKKRARNISISIMLYMLSVVALLLISCLPSYLGKGNEGVNEIIGVVVMLIIVAVATGLLVYTKLSSPVEQNKQLSTEIKDKKSKNLSKNKKINAILKSFMPFVLVIYLGVSFLTGAWNITWIIWLIAVAVKNAIIQFTYIDEEEEEVENGN